MGSSPLRVVQWTTGKVAREAVIAILERPDLELIGAYAFSPEKAGKDVGELCELDRTLGVTATNDIDEIVGWKPDCVVYMPLHPDFDHLVTLLQAGINVVTTAHFMTGRAYGQEATERIEAAAIAGNASLFGSGINPGFAQYLAAAASNVSRKVTYVRILESFDIGNWAGDANQDELGWGRPAGDPGHAADAEKATIPFGDACEALADLLGLKLDDVRCEVDFAHATKDLNIPNRTVKAGTVAGISASWIGSAEGVDAVECAVNWTISPDITPAWDIKMAYRMEVEGYPNVTLRAEVLPDMNGMDMKEIGYVGSVITAMPVVNAIPAVVDARPGIVGYRDLNVVAGHLVPDAAARAASAKPTASSRFSRSSTVQELSVTRVGRLLKRVITKQAKSMAKTEEEATLFANSAVYMSVENLVEMSEGKLPWPVADSVIDIANGEPSRVFVRAGNGIRSSVGRVLGKLRPGK